mmetsp:Transcript_58857/g.137023  ORF Transcript_58857/g.137023 Transcript_58857/m.137023 type:complete len:472 (+) Transcript_58857:82-1497(+)
MTSDPTQEVAAFGAKSIGFVGSLSMLLNNILGPGIANFPAIYQRAGWAPPSALVLVCALSSLAGGELLVMAVRSMPGNNDFGQRVEYSTLLRHYFRSRAAVAGIVLFLLAMLSANISNIIQTAQVFDQTIDALFGDSCALEVYPSLFRFFCNTNSTDITPFGTGKVLLSVGAVAVATLSVPLGYWNLDDNIVVQNVALLFILLSLLLWFAIFLALGLEPQRTPFSRAGEGLSNLHGVGGTILFNFMFISTLPSWLCEKRPTVTAVRVIFCTLVLASFMFAAVGLGGGMGFREYYNTDNTLLSELHHISRPKSLKVLASFSVDVYAIAANLASIPIYSIMVRYNLVEQQILGPRRAGFVAVILPWVLGVTFYCGTGFAMVVQYAGTFTSSIVNLIVPSLLFIAAQRSSHPLGPSELQSLSSPGQPLALVRDRSGLLTSSRQRKVWLAIAWANVAVMSLLTLVSIADQLANGA